MNTRTTKDKTMYTARGKNVIKKSKKRIGIAHVRGAIESPVPKKKKNTDTRQKFQVCSTARNDGC